MRSVPPGTGAAVEDAGAEADELLPPADPDELHAAMPAASRTAPDTATRARRPCRLFRNISCAPWLRALCASSRALAEPASRTRICQQRKLGPLSGEKPENHDSLSIPAND